jgi:predicted  nucleic acid-binding Zn-ribbon protein
MTELNQGLQRLHEALLQLREVTEQLERGPRQVRAREQLVAKTSEQLAAKREALKRAKADADRKALELKSNEVKIADLQRKLNAASSNREYDLLRGHLEADSVANSVLEDEILEALEVVDRLQMELAEAEAHAERARRERDQWAEKVAGAEAGLRAQAEQLKSAVLAAERVLTGDAAVQYRRLHDAYGADALAAVDGKVCTHCHVAIPPQARVALNSGGLMFCNCGRLLYVPTGSANRT